MKILIFGPSGSGKTFLSSKLKAMGINTMDADTIEGLSSWFDGDGKKVAYPENADKEFLDNHSLLWDKKFLEDFLQKHPTIYIFGVSGNIFEMLDIFDKVYFLKVSSEVQVERLQHETRKNPMGNTEYQRQNAVNWGLSLERKAKKLHITFIDSTKDPIAILQEIDR